jgi:outer membrane protein TolC
LLLVLSSAAVGQRLTLDEAVRLARENSEELQIAREELLRSELKAQESSGQRLPTLDFSGQYVFTSEVMKMVQPATTVDLGVTSFTIPGQEISFGDEHTSEFKLQVTQPIFTGFALHKAHKAYQWEVKARQSALRQVEWEVSCNAEELYVKAQKASALVDAAGKHVEILGRHLEEALEKVAAGVAPEELSARADLALQQAQLQLQSVERCRKIAFLALAEFISWEGNYRELAIDALPEEEPEIIAVLDLVEKAFTHREEVEQLRHQKEVLRELIGVSQSDYYPSLVAFGALNYGRPGADRFANEWMFYQTAGVSLNWTLWDWKKRGSRVQQVMVSGRQLDESQSLLASRIHLEVETAVQALSEAVERYELAVKSFGLSEKILDWTKNRYQKGLATETEYLDAVDDLVNSEIQRTVAVAEYFLSLIQLKRTCGTDILE